MVLCCQRYGDSLTAALARVARAWAEAPSSHCTVISSSIVPAMRALLPYNHETISEAGALPTTTELKLSLFITATPLWIRVSSSSNLFKNWINQFLKLLAFIQMWYWGTEDYFPGPKINFYSSMMRRGRFFRLSLLAVQNTPVIRTVPCLACKIILVNPRFTQMKKKIGLIASLCGWLVFRIKKKSGSDSYNVRLTHRS
jgi:hypothetical protein